jgi:hypothetical protein
VGRPTKWGNPFIVGRQSTKGHVYKYAWAASAKPGTLSHTVHKFIGYYREKRADAIADAVMYYRDYLKGSSLDYSELRGKDLACWCPIDQPCHADVLIELANGRRTTHAADKNSNE